ncbi:MULTISPECIES: aminoglycoside phosphotransferase family protein [Gammaproteobacteria]|uniref:aminoglycoside phosphotransferase family protein n=1 Tax=Gammaproteobacteria TaxID=1236 RepID=UPI0014039631|nr:MULTISPECIES: phosphotransferase [Gammaproteobacteria]
MSSENRQEFLKQWINKSELISIENIELLAGDASFRKYFRVSGKLRDDAEKSTLVLVDAPPPESLEPFVSVAMAYEEQGVRVPRIYLSDENLGAMLLEDIGDRLLLSDTNNNIEAVTQRYKQAIDLLPGVMAVTGTRQGDLPPYNEELLARENALFKDWLLEQYLGLTLDHEELKLWTEFSTQLTQKALAQQQVGVHRDYHSRNLMVNEQNELVAIDFQDAVVGPISYDLVSLVRDCYVDWPAELVENLLGYGFDTLRKHNLLNSSCSAAQFQSDFDWMGMQRHTKASGIFARLFLRDGKAGYLNDIPHTVNYLLAVSAQYPECAEYHDWLKSRVVPALNKVSS